MTVSLPLLKDPSFNERQPREQLGLGQDDVATALQTAIDGLSTPACVALYGAWGSGKTTLLHHAYSQLRDPNKSIHRVAWFDPWEYEQRGDVLEALIFRIAQQLVPTDEKVHQFKTLALKVARGLGSLTLRVGAAAAAGTLLGLGWS